MKELLRGLTSEDLQKNADFFQVQPDYRIIEDIQKDLSSEIYGQDKALNQLARAVTRSYAGFSDPKRPEGVFMFLGPTGVGKTESAKSLAKYFHPKGWEKHFLRIDSTQLQEPHSVGRLKGSEPSYVGYGDNNILITPNFLKQKDNVIIFDEIEKAHPNIWKWLLPVMEEGQQTVLIPTKTEGHNSHAELQTLDFANSYLIFTANVGAQALHKARMGEQGIGFHTRESKPDMEKIGTGELKKAFEGMPEFLGRLDSTVVFEDLQRPQYERIFNKFLDEINRDQRYGLNLLAVTSELRDYILDKAETGEYGAREIRHKINQFVLDMASEIKVSGVLKEGHPLIGDLKEGKIVFWTSHLYLEDDRPQPEVHAVAPTKKKDASPTDTRDAGSYIGNKEDLGGEPPVPAEKNTGEEDIKKPKDLVDLFVTYEDGTVENVGTYDRWMANNIMADFAMGEKWGDKRVVSSIQRPSEAKKGKPITFYLPPDLPEMTIDLIIQVKEKGKPDKKQIVENLPLI